MEEGKGFTVRDRRRVKMEAESAETEAQQGSSERPEEQGNEKGEASAGKEPERGARLPPVDFPGFVIGLAQMALMHLGEIPEARGGIGEVDLEQARHAIDILDMLDAKTRGNLTEDEEQLLRHLRSDLKLRFVRAASGSGAES